MGNLIGSPVAGTLYQRWGFRAPFIFGILITGLELLVRLLLIERHEAMRWGIDPMAVVVSDEEKGPEVASGATALEDAKKHPGSESQPAAQERRDEAPVCQGEGLTNVEEAKEGNGREKKLQESKQSRVILLPHVMLLRLMKSPRATVSILLAFIWGLAWTVQETTVVLHMNRVWGLDSHQAGIAFLASIVPTVFCESGAFSLSLPYDVY